MRCGIVKPSVRSRAREPRLAITYFRMRIAGSSHVPVREPILSRNVRLESDFEFSRILQFCLTKFFSKLFNSKQQFLASQRTIGEEKITATYWLKRCGP